MCIKYYNNPPSPINANAFKLYLFQTLHKPTDEWLILWKYTYSIEILLLWKYTYSIRNTTMHIPPNKWSRNYFNFIYFKLCISQPMNGGYYGNIHIQYEILLGTYYCVHTTVYVLLCTFRFYSNP